MHAQLTPATVFWAANTPPSLAMIITHAQPTLVTLTLVAPTPPSLATTTTPALRIPATLPLDVSIRTSVRLAMTTIRARLTVAALKLVA
jgi:hypothetical protein